MLSQAKYGIIHYGLGFFIFSLMKLRVKFKLNKALDKKMALEFLNFKGGGIDFSRGILGIHPEIKILKNLTTKKKKQELINAYFDKFYKKHNDYLQKQIVRFSTEWRMIESEFMNEVDRTFKKYPLPNGRYIAYLSIINCNPRFLNNKTFQIFYFHPQGVRYVTMHELLHFIFYDYAIKKFPKIFKKTDTERGAFWDLAEIFNVIILSSPEFKRIHEQKNAPFYPEHEKYITRLAALWEKTRDVDRWLLRSYKYLMAKKRA